MACLILELRVEPLLSPLPAEPPLREDDAEWKDEADVSDPFEPVDSEDGERVGTVRWSDGEMRSPCSSTSITALCNCRVSSVIDSFGGKSGASLRSACWKLGMVAMSGDKAHGFVDEARSFSKVGSM